MAEREDEEMVIFICIYLLIGIGVQIAGMLIDDDWLADGIDALDEMTNGYHDHEANVLDVKQFKANKRLLIVNIIIWPINFILGIVYEIKWHLHLKNG